MNPDKTNYPVIKGLRKKGLPSAFRSLLALHVKMEFGGRGLAEKIGLGGQKKKYVYLYLGLLAFAFIPFVGVIFRVAHAVSSAFVSMGQPGVPIVLSVIGSQVVVVLFSLSHLMSSLYYATDLETLKALPLTPGAIMTSKLFSVYVAELIFSGLLMIPTIVTLGPKLGILDFWLFAPLAYILVPLIPISVSLLLVALLMRFTAKAKRRDLFRVFFGLVFIVMLLGFQYLNINTAKGGPEFIMDMLKQKNGLIQAMASYYPVAKWAAWGLTGESFFSRLSGFALFSVVSLGVMAISISVSQKFFLGGVTKEVAAKRRRSLAVSSGARREGQTVRGQGAGLKILGKAHSEVTAVTLKEFKVLVRNPTFFLTSLMNLLIVPVLFLMGFIAGGSDFSSLIDLIKQGGASDVFLLLLVGIHGAIVALNQIASTSISREGREFSLSKQIPVSPRDQIRGKMQFALYYALLQAITLVLVVGLLGRLDVGTMLFLLILGMILAWPVSTIGMLFDIFHPKLDWTEPNQAMKGNFGTMISGLLGVLYIAGIGFVTRLLLVLGLGRPWIYVVPGVLVIGTGFLLKEFLESVAEKRYAEIEM